MHPGYIIAGNANVIQPIRSPEQSPVYTSSILLINPVSQQSAHGIEHCSIGAPCNFWPAFQAITERRSAIADCSTGGGVGPSNCTAAAMASSCRFAASSCEADCVAVKSQWSVVAYQWSVFR